MAVLLGIPSHLIRDKAISADRDGELHISYLKYQTAVEAVSSLAKMVKDGEWPGKKPADLDVIDLVISKSMWYSHYKRLFPKVSQHYPDMLEWLKESADAPSDLEIWGEEKGLSYTFSDLVVWLDEKDKGKKGKERKNKKNKKDDTVIEDDVGKKTRRKKRN